MSDFHVQQLLPDDLMSLERQPSQALQLGVEAEPDWAEAQELCDQLESWACYWKGRMIGAIGIREIFPAMHGVAWALLGSDIGAGHLPMTRFARSRIMQSRLRRIEALVQCADAEAIIDLFPFAANDGQALLEAVLAMPTPEVAWARMVGLRPAHVLRHYGAGADTYMLCERVA